MMSKQKQKGTSFETAVKNYIIDVMDTDEEHIHREVLHGTQDVGDITGLKINGHKIVIECKNYGSSQPMPQWLREAHAECLNASAVAGVVVSKRRGIGLKSMGEQLVSMTLEDFLKIISVGNM